MNKKFGQNFLIRASAREKIVSLMGEIRKKEIFEIGPGLGSLTALMLERGANVKAFEIDHGFADVLRTRAFHDEEGFTLVEGDALKTMKAEGTVPSLIVGNLPYNVGSVLIADIIERAFLPEKMVFTLQKEVVDRMAAKEGSKDYSSFSILAQLDYEIRRAFTISPDAFFPEPNVDSAVVVMTKKRESLLDSDERKDFFILIRALFAERRKTIKNNLSRLIDKESASKALSLASIDEKERAENLTLYDIIRLLKSVRALKPEQA